MSEPAFPNAFHRDGNSADKPGMSIRDYFAAKAMQAMCFDSLNNGNNLIANKLSRTAYKIADAMIVEREK